MIFQINNEWWRVVLVPQYHWKLFRSNGSLTIGACDDIDKTIYINENLNGSLLRKVLCHEITHAAMFSYDVNLSLEQEELLADLIATYGDEIIAVTNKIFKKLEGW